MVKSSKRLGNVFLERIGINFTLRRLSMYIHPVAR